MEKYKIQRFGQTSQLPTVKQAVVTYSRGHVEKLPAVTPAIHDSTEVVLDTK